MRRQGLLLLPVLLLVSLAAVRVGGDGEWDNVHRRYWSDRGLNNPEEELRRMADWGLLYFKNAGKQHTVTLVTIASAVAMQSYVPTLLENLASFKCVAAVTGAGRPACLPRDRVDARLPRLACCGTAAAPKECVANAGRPLPWPLPMMTCTQVRRAVQHLRPAN